MLGKGGVEKDAAISFVHPSDVDTEATNAGAVSHFSQLQSFIGSKDDEVWDNRGRPSLAQGRNAILPPMANSSSVFTPDSLRTLSPEVTFC